MKAWKIQKFAGDVVYDLRSRGLLPVAVLLIVGMVALPIYISMGSSSEPVPPPSPAESAAELAPENQAAVLAYNPGLRDYKKRLGELTSKDPFTQQFSNSAAASEAAADAFGSVEASDLGPTDGDLSPSTGGGTGSGKSTGGSGRGKTETKYYFYEVDVEVGETGGDSDRKDSIDPFDYLPSGEAPVLVYLGAGSDGKTAIFLVSKDVLSHEGSGECFPAPDACQLLGLRQGESEDLVWGVDGKSYTIKVRSVKLKVTRKPPKG